MKVKPIDREPTRFFVEGKTLVCSNANLDRQIGCQFIAKSSAKNPLSAGDPCPKCGNLDGVLVPRTHLVDIAAYNGNGKCACEFFDFRLRPKVEAMNRAQRQEVRLRCGHIFAARDHALDALLAELNERARRDNPNHVNQSKDEA